MNLASILSELRKATSDLHVGMETQLSLLRTDLSVLEYTEILMGFHSFYEWLGSQWDQNVANGNETKTWTPDFSERVQALKTDLNILDVKPKTKAMVAPPTDLTFNGIDWWGVFYVVEGSSLGGQVIRRYFETHLPTLAPATRYFSGRAEGTGARWKSFLLNLSELKLDQESEKKIAHAGRVAFQKLSEFLPASKLTLELNPL